MTGQPSDRSVTVVARVSCDAELARRLFDALGEMLTPGEAAVAAVADAGGDWSVEIHFAQAPDKPAVRKLIAAIAGTTTADALTFETVAPRDWVAASLAGLKPVTAGRFTVHGEHDRANVAPNRIGIEIEAALAFGTGHHGTTRGCLLALDALLKRGFGEGRRRARVLDIGTGTGVLAIAAAKALRSRVVASDIDQRAVTVARANTHANRVGTLVEVVHAAGLAAGPLRDGGPYDLVLANILLPPLTRLAAPVGRVLAPNARVILSGLLRSQANAALAAYRAQGLTLEARIPLHEWVTLVLKR